MLTIPRNWREKPQRYMLKGGKCKDCGYTMYPARKVCPKCHSENIEIIDLPREGKILTYTVIYSAPEGFEDFSPYAVAIVELTNGARLMLQIVDTDFNNIEIGKKVSVVFRRLFVEGKAGIIIYGPKAIVED
ncbi:MAG: Zn-ribbon domain-containing OB-fold protein [Desulfurella sp.]|uniref:Transcriptional regulator n=1 Tax=Desulfurella multipotens TaxID=79269 RepID=A0A1G6RH13_9BACT|nr:MULTISPECIES: Zn-ribbon domain-containing OB-fold protein [Desulfurella]AHF97300.1 AcaC [Desulfurella acetivorans A63]PMP92741.1 MAG: transcriptional regulator [Desulfurella sp.]SDD03216.1 hypothetical protein SAMN05660835_01784 [Desulfurella multipotens]HEX13051.1 Zn-ribbon domain-containing OB-fold protein [Desulfurella acetivorans]